MSEYCAVTILQSTGVDIELLSIAIIFYWNSQDADTILQLLLALWNTFKKILDEASTIILPDHINPMLI